MTTESASPNPRFRPARVVTAASPEERLERGLADSDRMYELYEEMLAQAAREADFAQIARLARVAAGAPDRDRAYAAQHVAAALLLAASGSLPHDDTWTWTVPLDHLVEVLMPVLDATPHEPALLDQLGVAIYELGHTALARRLFETVREIDPDRDSARQHLRACKERMRASAKLAPVEEHRTPNFARARTHIKQLAERARRLPELTVSLCMIVKDEEEMLPGCLAAVAEHVDEMIVVDTGSSDRTREIAREYGAKVVDFAWTGSFSDARNESLRHATSDWVLYLDADEHLVAGDGAKLRELARRTWVEGFHLVETHFMGDGEHGSEATHTPMRMFRRRPGREWRGTVHEQVTWSLPTWLPDRMQYTSVRVDHFGYLSSVISDRDKHERNLELLMAQVEQERSSFTLFNIGTEHAAMQDWTTARVWFEEALELMRRDAGWQEQQYAPLLVQRTITARRSTGDVGSSIQLIDEALSWWPQYTDLVYERALAHVTLQQWDDAIEQSRRALGMGDAPARFVSISGKGSFQARMLLASVLRRQGQIAEARAELETTVAEAPHFPAALGELADLLLRTSETPAEVNRIVDEVLGERATAAGPNLLIGAVLHEAGAFDEADARYERALAVNPTHPGVLVAQSELRLAQGKLREAWDIGMALDALDPMAARGALSAFVAALALDDVTLLGEPAGRIATGDALSPTERAVYVAWHALADPEAGVRAIVPQDPLAVATLMRMLEALIKLEATDAFERAFPLIEQVIPEERARRLSLADLYLRMRFADMAGEELLLVAEKFGPDASVLTGLGKVATIKGMWEDAEVFLTEALQHDPSQLETRTLLAAVRERQAG